MLGAFTLAAGELGAGLLIPAPPAPRITPPTIATIRAYQSAAGIVDHDTDAHIGPTLG